MARHKYKEHTDLHLGYSLRKLAHTIHGDFFSHKNKKNHHKNFDIVNICAQNIDCGYTLEPPR